MIYLVLRVIWIAFYAWFLWTNSRSVIAGLRSGVIVLPEGATPIRREAEPDRFRRSLAWRSFLALGAFILAAFPIVTLIFHPAQTLVVIGAPNAIAPSL